MSVKYVKALVLLSLGSILVLCTNCGSPFSSSTPLYFSSNIYGGSAGVSYNSFGNTVYPITRANCVSCHATQQPTHASKNLEEAHDSLIKGFKVNFADIPNSRMVKKLRDENHNCWGDCESNAAEMEQAIKEWHNDIKNSGGGGSQQAAVPVTQTAESKVLLEEFLVPANTIRGNVANIFMETAVVTPPMQKALDGTNGSYAWIPTALTTILTPDSTVAGKATVNFTIRQGGGGYRIWGLVNAQGADDDGFFVNVTTTTDDPSTVGWEIPKTQNFEWREFTGTMWGFPAGAHTMEIRPRKGGVKLKQVVVTTDQNFNGRNASDFTAITLTYDLADILKVPGITFKIDVTDYDEFSYRFQNPRITTPAGTNVRVKGVKLLVNKAYNPQHSTYNLIDKIATPADGRLSDYGMVVIKEKGLAQDKISFAFETLKLSSSAGGGGGATDPDLMASQEAFRSTVYPISRASCIACHTGQNPPHAHDDYLLAFDAVVNSNLANFTAPATSRLVTKTRGRHNCGTQAQCDAIAAQFVNAITEWAKNRP